jgi:hypothetical protein
VRSTHSKIDKLMNINDSPKSSYFFRDTSLVRKGALFAVILCTGVFTISGTAFSATPRGLYSVSSIGKKTQQPVLDNPSVDGISIRQNWADLEKREGVFDFTFLDTEIGRAATAGKPVLLRIYSMGGRPTWVDGAVRRAGGKFFKWVNNGVNTSIPLFWDPTFLAKKTAMITALGAHFASNPTVKIVSCSFANATTEDWVVPHTNDLVPQWQRLGYTTANMLVAAQTIIDATMAAFPNSQVTMAVGGTGNTLDGGDDVLARAAVDSAKLRWPGRLTIQKNDLSTCLPSPPGTGFIYAVLWDNRPDVAGQFLGVVYNDTGYKVNCGIIGLADVIFTAAISEAILYSEQYVEAYETDVTRLLPVTITAAHTALVTQPSLAPG